MVGFVKRLVDEGSEDRVGYNFVVYGCDVT